MGWKPPPCGTYGGYQRHWRRGEQACEPCLRAATAYSVDRRRTLRYRSPETQIRDVCGTLRGHSRHRSHGEPPCDACMAARRTHERERYVARKGAAR